MRPFDSCAKRAKTAAVHERICSPSRRARRPNETWEYVAADNPAAADHVLEEIYEAIRALVPFPQVGHRRSDLTSRPLRFHPLRDFLIVYAPDEKPLVVLAILHGRRNPRVIAALLRERK